MSHVLDRDASESEMQEVLALARVIDTTVCGNHGHVVVAALTLVVGRVILQQTLGDRLAFDTAVDTTVENLRRTWQHAAETAALAAATAQTTARVRES